MHYLFSTNYTFLDSAIIDNYSNNETPINNKNKISKAVPIHLINRLIMTPTHKGIFSNLLEINMKYKTYQTCSTSNGPVLLFLGKLCDDKYIVVYEYKKCIIYKDKPILRANRYSITGMYITNLNNPKLELPIVELTYKNLDKFSRNKELLLVHTNLQQFSSIK